MVTAKTNVNHLKKELSRSQDIMFNYASEIQSLKTDRDSLTQANAELRAENDDLVNDMHDVINENEELALSLNKAICSKEHLKSQVEALGRERDSMEDILICEREKMKRSTSTIVAVNVSLQSCIHKMSAEKFELEQKLRMYLKQGDINMQMDDAKKIKKTISMVELPKCSQGIAKGFPNSASLTKIIENCNFANSNNSGVGLDIYQTEKSFSPTLTPTLVKAQIQNKKRLEEIHNNANMECSRMVEDSAFPYDVEADETLNAKTPAHTEFLPKQDPMKNPFFNPECIVLMSANSSSSGEILVDFPNEVEDASVVSSCVTERILSKAVALGKQKAMKRTTSTLDNENKMEKEQDRFHSTSASALSKLGLQGRSMNSFRKNKVIHDKRFSKNALRNLPFYASG